MGNTRNSQHFVCLFYQPAPLNFTGLSVVVLGLVITVSSAELFIELV